MIKETQKVRKPYLAAMIGTSVEHYDNALYGFMAPILVPLFLPNVDPVVGYILTFCMYSLGLIFKPLGAIVMGRIGDEYGRKRALTISIMGMALVTGLMGCLPTYAVIGIWAPILILFLRLLQAFFVAGEYNGGAIFTLESTDKGKRGWMSGVYCASTVAGILVASLVSTVVAYLPAGWWRLAYLLGFGTAIVGIYIRRNVDETPEFKNRKVPVRQEGLFEKISKYRRVFICGIAGACFFSVIYCIPAVFMSAFLPLATEHSISLMMLINTIALAVYMFALPIGGLLADRFGFYKSMITAAICGGGLSIPLFVLLGKGSLEMVIGVKIAFAVLAAWFIGPFHAWMQSLFDVSSRYQMISLAYAVGSRIGGASPMLAMWLWKVNGNFYVPAILIALSSLLGAGAVWYSREEEEFNPLAQGDLVN